MKNLDCNQIKNFVNLEIIGRRKIIYIYIYIYLFIYFLKSKNLKKKSAIKDALECVV